MRSPLYLSHIEPSRDVYKTKSQRVYFDELSRHGLIE